MTDPNVVQRQLPNLPEAEAFSNSLFQLCRQNATINISNGKMNPAPLHTIYNVTTEQFNDAAKANADPTRLVKIAKEFCRRHGFLTSHMPIDDRNCWLIPYSATVTHFKEASQYGANVGHLARVPRRPRRAGGHTQFDTRITFGMEEPACFEVIDPDNLSDFRPYLNDAKRALLPGANNVAILVKLSLGLQLAERYGDNETVKSMFRVIDEFNRPVFIPSNTRNVVTERGVSVSPWQPYLNGVAKGTHHIYTSSQCNQRLAHCLYLASVEWPFWRDVDFEQNLVPPQLAVEIEGIPGNNVVFVDSISEKSFGNKIRFPSEGDWRCAIHYFAQSEFAHEECCYAREIAARITFYWPEHAPESHHRDIPGLDAAALTTFFNGDLVLPRPRVGRSVFHLSLPYTDYWILWNRRMEALLSMSLQEGIVYDNLVGRSIGYAQGCVNQSSSISTDYLLCDYDTARAPMKWHLRLLPFKMLSGFEQIWYVIGHRIFNFMPSSKSIELYSESVSRKRNFTNRHRLVSRPAHRLISSSQVLDIMAVMPDACYLGIGNIALSNVESNLFRSGSTLCCDTFFPKFAPTSENYTFTMDHDSARTLANFIRCLGISTVEDRPNYYFKYEPQDGVPFDSWHPVEIIYDPVFIHWPEEATWTTYDGLKPTRRSFMIQNSNTNTQPSNWATLLSQLKGKAVNESVIPAAGIIDCNIWKPTPIHRINPDQMFGHALMAPIVYPQ